MELKEYQARALETALPTALTPEYLVPGLVAEIGELFGVQAKAVRDGWDEYQVETALVKEYGDVAWFAAVLIHEYRETWKMCDTVYLYPGSRSIDAMNLLMEHATSLSENYFDSFDIDVRANAHQIWRLLEENSEKITGSTFDQVLEVNLAKLADRKERGVISGSGDSR